MTPCIIANQVLYTDINEYFELLNSG